MPLRLTDGKVLSGNDLRVCLEDTLSGVFSLPRKRPKSWLHQGRANVMNASTVLLAPRHPRHGITVTRTVSTLERWQGYPSSRHLIYARARVSEKNLGAIWPPSFHFCSLEQELMEYNKLNTFA